MRYDRAQLDVVPDYRALSGRAAQVVAEVLRRLPDAAISLTTGRTVLGLYQALRGLHQSGKVDLRAVRLVSSEEYAGIGPADPISLFGWLHRELLGPCSIPADHVLHFAGDAPDLEAECRRFDAALAAWGGPDLVVQSVGVNGHFGFNEPGSSPDAPSRPVALTSSTLEANSAYWPAGIQLPRRGLTMGVRPTLQAGHILLLASGERKAGALVRALEGEIDARVPCSLLRRSPRLTVIAEAAAAAALNGHQRAGEGPAAQ